MGPPETVPSQAWASLSGSSTVRWIWARVTSVNFVAMPRNAVTHIQNRAPGPPRWMARATPAMFPIPTVADRAVVRAWKWETSPGSSGSSYFPVVMAKPWPRRRSWMKPRRKVR